MTISQAEQGSHGGPALPTPRDRVRVLSVEVTQLLAALDEACTPQAVFEGLADAHHHLVLALAAYKAHDEYQGRHRNHSLSSRILNGHRETAEQRHGPSYVGAHRP